MAKELNIGFLQADLVWEDVDANLNKFEQKIAQFSANIDLIILPEMFSTGFSMNAKELSEPGTGRTFQWMQRMAAQKDAAVTGSFICSEQEHYYNRLYFVYPDGSHEKYDKRHTFTLAKEHETYSAGTEKLVVDFKGWRICPLVCYDLRFPVWSRNVEDYDLLLYVANWPATRVTAWDVLLRARAIENMCYCLGLNRVGKDGKDLGYVGHSAIYNPLGEKISRKESEDEFQEEVVIDMDQLNEIRSNFQFLQDRDHFTLL